MIRKNQGRIWALLFIAIAILFADLSFADIYRYLDKEGVWHFTNIKPDTRYQLYIKTPERKTIVEAIGDYETVIKQAADRFGVDPLLVKAVIKTESDFDHRAVSVKGAKGLMQLMPGTAEALAVKDSFDPAENIFGGTRYLSMLLNRFNGDKGLALAGYNAGPEKVAAGGKIPRIPETEAFVKKVMEYYNSFLAEGR